MSCGRTLTGHEHGSNASMTVATPQGAPRDTGNGGSGQQHGPTEGIEIGADIVVA